MPSKAQERRRTLRETLINIAQQRIIADGLSSLRARDLAREAGCALGAIYNAVGDLAELTLAVNARTFHELGFFVAEQTPRNADPVDTLVAMAQAYHHFAAENHNAWRALFDIERAPGTTAPDWYLQEMEKLFALIHEPLSKLNPDLAQTDLTLLTRALFSAVHGIVWLALDEASAGVPSGQTDQMINLILRRLA